MNPPGQPPLPPPTTDTCRNCGQSLPTGVAFCPHCGASRATGQVSQGLSIWRVLGAMCVGCLGLAVGGFGACLAVIGGLDRTGLDPSFYGVVVLCLALGVAFIFGFIKLLRKP